MRNKDEHKHQAVVAVMITQSGVVDGINYLHCMAKRRPAGAALLNNNYRTGSVRLQCCTQPFRLALPTSRPRLRSLNGPAAITEHVPQPAQQHRPQHRQSKSSKHLPTPSANPKANHSPPLINALTPNKHARQSRESTDRYNVHVRRITYGEAIVLVEVAQQSILLFERRCTATHSAPLHQPAVTQTAVRVMWTWMACERNWPLNSTSDK